MLHLSEQKKSIISIYPHEKHFHKKIVSKIIYEWRYSE
ncbi:hypothetical protein GM3709_769 [Geminocystis sp. NIES-3709]|nr:hypothetical protein GM3709_769 [Geminocystis sp. NIES-3709]